MKATETEDEGLVRSTEKESDFNRTPFGLPRMLVITAHLLAITLTGLAVQAADPLIEMMKLNGAYRDLEPPALRASSIASVVSVGISCTVLSGIVAGPLIDFLGAKITALLGLGLHAAGYGLMFLLDIQSLYYLSAVCFGCAYQFIKNSHVSIACLFPKRSNLILTLLSAAVDLSMLLPAGIRYVALAYGDGSTGLRKAVMQYLLICVPVAFVIELLLLPPKSYRNLKELKQSSDLETEPLLSGAIDEKVVLDSNSDLPPFSHLSVMEQLRTFDFWIFVILLALTFCRKKHFTLMVRPILAELDSDPLKATAHGYVEKYNSLVPAGFIPAIVWGLLVDRFGINVCILASNLLGTLVVALSLIPSLRLQVLTITLFIIYQCWVMGQCLGFAASVYGFRTLATLQGVCCFVIGICSLLMDVYWLPFIHGTLGSYRAASLVWLVVSLLILFIPIYFMSKASIRRKWQKRTIESVDRR